MSTLRKVCTGKAESKSSFSSRVSSPTMRITKEVPGFLAQLFGGEKKKAKLEHYENVSKKQVTGEMSC